MKKALIFIALIVVAIAISLAVYLTNTPVSKSVEGLVHWIRRLILLFTHVGQWI